MEYYTLSVNIIQANIELNLHLQEIKTHLQSATHLQGNLKLKNHLKLSNFYLVFNPERFLIFTLISRNYLKTINKIYFF